MEDVYTDRGRDEYVVQQERDTQRNMNIYQYHASPRAPEICLSDRRSTDKL